MESQSVMPAADAASAATKYEGIGDSDGRAVSSARAAGAKDAPDNGLLHAFEHEGVVDESGCR